MFPGMEQIILRPEERSLPLHVSDGSGGSVFLEIGFGNGEFPVHLAGSRPRDLVFGIEVSMTCVLKAARRALRGNIGNVHFMMGDARFLLRECFPDLSLDRVYMNFPCPWPKSRHAKRRVTNPSFADALASVLKISGYYELVTDEEWYAHEVRDILGSHSSMRLKEYTINPERPVTTKYERKWLEMGKNIHLVRIEKIKDFTIKRVLSEVDAEMHLKANLQGITLESLRVLYNHEGGEKGNHWVFKESFSSGEDLFLIEVIASDEGFEQKFFIRIASSGEEVIFKLAETGSPFRTPAVKGALHHIVELLRDGYVR